MHKTILMLAGLPGTGKSTLAAYLASTRGWVIVDKDLIHSALLTHGQTKDESGGVAYTVSLELVKDFATRQNKSVIFDSAGRQQFILTKLEDICAASQAMLKVIHCTAAQAERQKRLLARNTLASQLTEDMFTDDEEAHFYEHLPHGRLKVDTTAGVKDILKVCLDYLYA